MIKFPVLGDRSVEDLLREVVGTDISANSDGIPSECFDLLNDKLSLLFVKAAEADVSMGFRGGGHELNVLADHNLRTLFGKCDGSTLANSLRRGSR